MVIKISFIGYKNQSEKLQQILIKKKIKIEKIFHPTKNFNNETFTNNFAELYKSDIVIIASPNNTHYYYIKKLLNNFSGYIFCEKPPVINKNELKNLEKISNKDKKRLFFNFNLRFSEINNQIHEQLRSKNIGIPVFINIISSKGLAFKKEYVNSWRADGRNNPHNILDAVTIHFIDLLNLHFGEIKNYNYQPALVSKNGTSFDTAYVSLQFKNGLMASIFNSYSTPLYNEFSILGTNGIFTINNKNLKILSPRDTFNSKGFFSTPPVRTFHNISFEKEFQKSTENTLEYFLMCVRKKKPIETKFFESSISANKIILEMKEQKKSKI